MISLPIISRELRVTARAPANYRLRVVVGAIAIVLLALTMLGSGSGLNRGDALFYAIHQFGISALVVLAPLLTADVISRERREGTLDLLFLTPLTATKLVFAKFATQLFRLLSIWAVLIPLSVVPFLSGGLAPVDVLRMLLLELTAILIALTAGMLASAFSQRALPATLLALTFTGLFLWIDWELLNIQGITRPGSSRWTTEAILATNFGIVLLGSIFALLRIARLIRQGNREENSPRRIWFRQTFLAPRFWRQKFNLTMRRRMNRNPLIWLEYRTAWSRVGRTAMIGAVILIESFLLASEWAIQELPSVHVLMGFVILVVLAITSASSFQREKESGAFELLLVAPFTEFSLIFGRLRAVWSYYAPVVLTLLILVVFTFSVGIDWGISSYYFFDYDSSRSEGARFWSGAASFVTIPIAGLFFALRLKHLITTLIATVAFGFVLPMYFWPIIEAVLLYFSRWFFESGFIGMLVHPFENGLFPWTSASLALHVGLCAYFLAKTHQRLKSRNFN